MVRTSLVISVVSKLLANIFLSYIFLGIIHGLREEMRGLYGTSVLDFYYFCTSFGLIILISTHLATRSCAGSAFVLLTLQYWGTQFHEINQWYMSVSILLIAIGIGMDCVKMK